MTPEEIWRAKSDEEVIVAASRLSEYTDLGRRLILDELDRRELARPGAGLGSQAEDGTASPASDLVNAELSPSTNGFLRLWRGEFSLPATYWGWGVTGNIVWAGIMSVALANKNLGAGLVLLVLYLGYSVVVWVAIWRSANRYTGPRVWRDLAKVSIALSIFRSIAQLVVGR